MEKQQEERQKLVKRVCTPKDANLPAMSYRFLYVDDSRKFIYCSIPKAANTNWKLFMLHSTPQFQKDYPNDTYSYRTLLRPNITILEHYGIKKLNNYNEKEIQYRLKNYFKVIFPRHPVIKLLSAYRNKFYSKRNETYYNYHGFGEEIAQLYRKKNDESRPKDHAYFHEFAKWAINEGKDKNIHWFPLERICLTCHIHYDFIGSFENLNDEYHCIMPHISNDSRMYFPNNSGPSSARFYPNSPNTKSSTIRECFQNVSHTLLLSIAQYYRKDCEMFGYDCLKLY